MVKGRRGDAGFRERASPFDPRRRLLLIPAVSIFTFAALTSRETDADDAGDVKVVVYLALFETRPYVALRVFTSRVALEGKESPGTCVRKNL